MDQLLGPKFSAFAKYGILVEEALGQVSTEKLSSTQNPSGHDSSHF
jgi:hypothetical protein